MALTMPNLDEKVDFQKCHTVSVLSYFSRIHIQAELALNQVC